MYYRNSSGLGTLLGILILCAIVFYVVVYIILPVSTFILLGIGTVGATSGVGIALRNFQQLLVEAHRVEK